MEAESRGAKWYLVRTAAIASLLVLLALTVHVTTRKDTTNTETGLWTFILFAIGIGMSYYFGRKSVTEAAADVVRPQARSAGRRLVTLGQGIGALEKMVALHHRAAKEAAEANGGTVPIESVELACGSLQIEIDQQYRTVVDALEDWRHFDPELVMGPAGDDEDG